MTGGPGEKIRVVGFSQSGILDASDVEIRLCAGKMCTLTHRACAVDAPAAFHVVKPPYNQMWRWKMDPRALLADIHTLEEEILAFERRYGIRSETFYAAYASGEEPEDDRWVLDFGEWASVYRTWLTRQADYRNEIQRRQPNAPSLAGLIQVAQ
jgi:hypothetical protein